LDLPKTAEESACGYLLATNLQSFGPAADGQPTQIGFVEVPRDFLEWMVLCRFKGVLKEKTMAFLRQLHTFLLELCSHGMGKRYGRREVLTGFPATASLQFDDQGNDVHVQSFNPAFAVSGTNLMGGCLDNLCLAGTRLQQCAGECKSTGDVMYALCGRLVKNKPLGLVLEPCLGDKPCIVFKGRKYLAPTSVLTLSRGEF